jgi:hypothetical protein
MTALMEIVDTALLPGHKVWLKEIRPVPWNDGGKLRRYFKVRIDDKPSSVVFMGGLLPDGLVLCVDHDRAPCQCKQAVAAYMEDETE